MTVYSEIEFFYYTSSIIQLLLQLGRVITFLGRGLCKTDQFASIMKETLEGFLVRVAFLSHWLA